MIIKHGDLWSTTADVILVTANATVNLRGQLVMGRGAALQASNRYPGVNLEFGKMVREWLEKYNTCYGVMMHPTIEDPKLGVFQVKRFYSSKATLEIIEYSANMLLRMIKR